MFYTAKLQDWNNRPSGVYKINIFLKIPWALVLHLLAGFQTTQLLWLTGVTTALFYYVWWEGELLPPSHTIAENSRPLSSTEGLSVLNFSHSYPPSPTVPEHALDAPFQTEILLSLSAPPFAMLDWHRGSGSSLSTHLLLQCCLTLTLLKLDGLQNTINSESIGYKKAWEKNKLTLQMVNLSSSYTLLQL